MSQNLNEKTRFLRSFVGIKYAGDEKLMVAGFTPLLRTSGRLFCRPWLLCIKTALDRPITKTRSLYGVINPHLTLSCILLLLASCLSSIHFNQSLDATNAASQ